MGRTGWRVLAGDRDRLTLDEALGTELSYPVRYVIELHRSELEGA
jgi:hypothetical protein